MKVYSYKREQVLTASLDYFDNDLLAATTWLKKYCLKDNQGNYLELTPDDMHVRLAREFYRIENSFYGTEKLSELSEYGKSRKKLSEKHIYEYFKNFKYIIPQGSVMALLGNSFAIGSLSNCVVIPSPNDSYGGILKADEQLVQLCKRRCGVGFDISNLRPTGTRINGPADTSSGAASFMERYSNSTREVSQSGRRGALMLTMHIEHPDISEFIVMKQDITKVTGANVSVLLTDEFMKKVENGEEYEQRWPINSRNPEVKRTAPARDIWNLIIQCAHKSAEPGILFWDRHHKYSTSSIYTEYRNESTNPCGEISMNGGDSCRLITLNLFSFVKKPFRENALFDFDKFYKITYEAQRLADNLVELELESIDRILNKIESDPENDSLKRTEREIWQLLYKNGAKGRRTGLGFTALADTIAALGMKYGEDKSQKVIEKIMQLKLMAEFDSSIDMSIERGSFEIFNPKIEEQSEFVIFLKEHFGSIYSRMMRFGRRNISISTVAPTGTVSLLTGTSSGIEPVFKLSYTRRRKMSKQDQAKSVIKDQVGDAWEEFDVNHPRLDQWRNENPLKKIQESPYMGSTAYDLSWSKRLKIQAIVQKYTTHSISSTINLPKDISQDKVGEIYFSAWKLGLKGITVYRDSSRRGVLITREENYENNICPQCREVDVLTKETGCVKCLKCNYSSCQP